MSLADAGPTSDDHASIRRLLPRYRYGVVLPGVGVVQRGVDYQFYRLVPTDVMQIGVGLGIRDYSRAGVEAAMDAFWTGANTLATEGADCIMLSGVPVSAGVGRARILDLINEVPRRTGVPFHATLEALIAALRHLDTPRVVIGSRFPPETNASIITYLNEAGIDVLGSTARELALAQARQLSMTDGMQLALDVGREAAAMAPDAQAILILGGATLSLHAVPTLEAELDKPVLVNLTAEIWHALIRTAIIPPVAGWGRLLADV